jgi:hypothetical protein
MSSSPHDPAAGAPRQPTEEEIRAAYEAELKKVTVEDVLAQTAVSLVNLAGRRLGVSQGTEDERDPEQVRDAIDAVRGLLPVLERRGAAEVAPLRDALSRLQMAYAQQAQGGAGAEGASEEPAGSPQPAATDPAQPAGEPGEGESGPGPAESSGRLWVPGR